MKRLQDQGIIGLGVANALQHQKIEVRCVFPFPLTIGGGGNPPPIEGSSPPPRGGFPPGFDSEEVIHEPLQNELINQRRSEDDIVSVPPSEAGSVAQEENFFYRFIRRVKEAKLVVDLIFGICVIFKKVRGLVSGI